MNPSIILTSKYGVLIYLVPAHTGPRRFRLPNAWAPTLVGTKLLCPSPPDRLRKSAKRWVTQVAVLHARFCAVALLERMEEKITLILILSSIINKKLSTILIQGKYSNNCVSIIDSHAYPFLLSFFVFFNYWVMCVFNLEWNKNSFYVKDDFIKGET